MILGDNPTGHGFVLRDLVFIELSGHAPPLQLGEEGEGGVKKFQKKSCWGGGQKFQFWW